MKIPPNILVLGLAFVLSSMQPTFGAQTAASDCLASPAPSAPKGEHWYYRINRADGRHCWYLSSQTAPAARPHLATSHVAPPDPVPEAPPDVPTQQDAQKTWPDAAFPEPASVGATIIAGRWPDVPLPASLSSDTQRISTPDVKEDVTAAQPAVQSEGSTVLPRSEWADIASILLIGAVAIASLLLVRIIFRSRSRLDRVFSALGRLGRRERPHADDMAPKDMAANDLAALNRPAPLRQDRMKRRGPTPTDPAQNLKASLNELMQDLQRARVADAEHSHISFAPASYR